MKLLQRQLGSSTLLLIIVLAFETAAGVAPTVHVPEQLHAGDELVVGCEATGAVTTDFNALKEIRYQFSVEGDYIGTANPTKNALKKASKEDHMGSWTCQTVVPKTGAISEHSSPKLLTIIDVPLQPTLQLSRTKVNDGDKVSFSCVVDLDSDTPTSYAFFVNGSHRMKLSEPSLTHPVIQETYEGDWSCTALNEAGESPASKKVPLQIKVGPCNCRRICSEAKFAWEDLKPILIGVAAGGVLVSLPFLMGFGPGGVVAGSFAAKLMALLGTGGLIIPFLQAWGATGLTFVKGLTFCSSGVLFAGLYQRIVSCGCKCDF